MFPYLIVPAIVWLSLDDTRTNAFDRILITATVAVTMYLFLVYGNAHYIPGC
jgi:hypothetical protein